MKKFLGGIFLILGLLSLSNIQATKQKKSIFQHTVSKGFIGSCAFCVAFGVVCLTSICLQVPSSPKNLATMLGAAFFAGCAANIAALYHPKITACTLTATALGVPPCMALLDQYCFNNIRY